MRTLLPQSCLWSIEPTRFRALAAQMPFVRVNLEEVEPRDQLAGPRRSAVNGVELVSISGILDKAESDFLDWFGGTAYETIGRQFAAALADPEISAIVLRIDSPGGTTDGLADLGDRLFAARGKKRVVAQVAGMAASAAYYLAAQADKIYAGRMDLVGSIGTVLPTEDLSRLYAAAGVEMLTFATGPFKGAGWPGTEITPAQREYFQGITDAFFADFLAAVRRGRKVEGLKAVADGRVFLAAEAKANGLIDGIRSLEDTIGGLAKVQGTPRRARASLDILLAEDGNGSAPSRAEGDALHPENLTEGDRA